MAMIIESTSKCGRLIRFGRIAKAAESPHRCFWRRTHNAAWVCWVQRRRNWGACLTLPFCRHQMVGNNTLAVHASSAGHCISIVRPAPQLLTSGTPCHYSRRRVMAPRLQVG